ncbi:MAG: tRNA-dihydrouridine synthase [Pseudomonadota bacterium]|uniref:tRNA-dihydrouridine synthase n=1 Tax=Gallaecimonas pentaromativorans TaxID=584787 RepID=UPI00067F0C5E|nr:tRNA-dihydrouridine synthase [Gallaecimonas pentaromativorans]MED5524388.1 tRNA-dihydrouridine synthase [Pseudomonadota bacterium]
MRVILAPMEGVVDHLMRDLLTAQGGFDLCVTEFLRVVDQLYPERSFFKICPELANGAKTPSGVPVRIQLLGQSPEWLAENAARAVALGSPGIDLNFGCPAKTVNRNKGGSVLLKEPETLYAIIREVRQAVPPHQPVTAKIRLGYDDTSLMLENARAIEAAGATELAVHARTKRDGYRPPAYWEQIALIRSEIGLNVIANGEIWSSDDAKRCQAVSGSTDLMIGRGALACPNLAAAIKGLAPKAPWEAVQALLKRYSQFEIRGDKGLYYPNRLKQWLQFLRLQYPEAEALFQKVRTLSDKEAMLESINP